MLNLFAENLQATISWKRGKVNSQVFYTINNLYERYKFHFQAENWFEMSSKILWKRVNRLEFVSIHIAWISNWIPYLMYNLFGFQLIYIWHLKSLELIWFEHCYLQMASNTISCQVLNYKNCNHGHLSLRSVTILGLAAAVGFNWHWRF